MIVYFHLLVISVVLGIGRSEKTTIFIKCCDNGSVLNESLVCDELPEENNEDEVHLDASTNMTNRTRMIYAVCFKNGEGGKLAEATGGALNYTCADVLANSTKELICNSESFVAHDTAQKCDSLFTQLRFWGATMVIFATIVYNVPFIIVVIIYSIFSELRVRAYDKGVICYNMCYIVINFLLITLGFYNLCHKTLSATAYRLFGLGLMFSTQGAVIWVLILCFDMTLVITRFRWAPKSGVDRGREEKRKFLIYSAWAWGFSSFLTLIPTVVEFTSIFPEDSPIRPNFQNFKDPNLAVIIYVITGPVLVCLTTSSLFIYTTIKTIAVQRSTAIVNENRKTNVMKKYLLFLKLYLVMDTPWFTSALAAIYDDLWVLKFIKMIQPTLMLILIIPRKRVWRAMRCNKRNANVEQEADRQNLDPRKRTNLRNVDKTDRQPNI